jgi:hypothetical protein
MRLPSSGCRACLRITQDGEEVPSPSAEITGSTRAMCIVVSADPTDASIFSSFREGAKVSLTSLCTSSLTSKGKRSKAIGSSWRGIPRSSALRRASSRAWPLGGSSENEPQPLVLGRPGEGTPYWYGVATSRRADATRSRTTSAALPRCYRGMLSFIIS